MNADEEISPCPPCPQCSHQHRFSGCVDCTCDLWTTSKARKRIAFIERQVKHMPAWLNEWDVRLLAAKEWELK